MKFFRYDKFLSSKSNLQFLLQNISECYCQLCTKKSYPLKFVFVHIESNLQILHIVISYFRKVNNGLVFT